MLCQVWNSNDPGRRTLLREMLADLCKGTDTNQPLGSWKSVPNHSCLGSNSCTAFAVVQDRRQSSSFRTTIGRVDAKQQRSHCLLELAEARQLRVSCVWVCTVDALLFCTAESFERRAAQLDQYFSAVWGMHHGNGAPAGVYKSSAVACLNSF